MEKSEVIEVIETCKSVILRYGWVQESYGDQFRGFCAEGAVDFSLLLLNRTSAAKWHAKFSRATTLFSTTYQSVIYELAKTIAPELKICNLVRFNDTPGRTKEDVLDLMDQTIKRLLDESVT